MSDVAAGRLAVELYGQHRQSGGRCEGCGEAWPCPTRQAAPGHYRPRRGIPTWRDATEVVARHTERDGHCTACGEEWMCWTRREAGAEFEAWSMQQPTW